MILMGQPDNPATGFRYIGKSIPRADAYEKVTGQARYPGDCSRPGMLAMKILFAGRPHARILQINLERALALPGVVAILTGKDVPVNNYGLAFNDQPVLCDQVVRCEGDQVALILAENEAIAAQARDLIEVAYQDLPAITDPRDAMQPGAFRLHGERGDNSHPDGNILSQIHIRRGDIEQGFASAEVIVENDYYLPMQEHVYLQPEAGLAYMEGDVVVIETAGQWAHHDQRQIARSLGIEPERVRMIYRTIGGAFGGREDISVQLVLALAAWKTGRPVKIVWTRPESIRGHGKRHQMFIHSRWGATRDGRIVAADVNVIADAGAYAYTSTMVLGHTALGCTGVYNIPNVHVDSYMVYTNNVPGAAFRGFGAPQGVFAAEMQIDQLAQKLGIDPISLRTRNLLHPGDPLSTGAPLPESVQLEPMLYQCARQMGWRETGRGWEKPASSPAHDQTEKTGFGIALGMKNICFSFGYPEESSAAIILRGGAEIDQVDLFFGGAECGQGLETVVLQMAAESLQVAIEKIRLIGADTTRSPEAGSASASRLTTLGGNAIRGAAEIALKNWVDEQRPAIGFFTYHAPLTTDFDPQTGSNPNPHVIFSPVAQAVEVRVDRETGQTRLQRVVSVVDSGQPINPQMLSGQVEGAVVQALGYTLIENFISENGVIKTPDLTTYLIPTVLDIPPIHEFSHCEHPEAIGPWGARGVGETPLIAIAPATASAVFDAVGVWCNRLPLTAQTVLTQLQDKQRESTRVAAATPQNHI